MKSFLQNLLIVLSLCLCGLAAFQWHREAKLRRDIESLQGEIRGKTEAIEGLQRSATRSDKEIKRLSDLRSGLAQSAESNRLETVRLRKEVETADTEIERNLKQIGDYKSALQQANDNIRLQNEQLKKLADERNEAVIKFNKLVEEYNDLVKKWNEQQKALSSTNVIPKKE